MLRFPGVRFLVRDVRELVRGVWFGRCFGSRLLLWFPVLDSVPGSGELNHVFWLVVRWCLLPVT